jgi:hypothetical protein
MPQLVVVVEIPLHVYIPYLLKVTTMNPITVKPLTTENLIQGSWETWWRRRQRSVQKAPYNLPLYFRLEEGMSVTGGDIFTWIGSPGESASGIAGQAKTSPTAQGLIVQAANISYERFREQVAENASLGVNFVEYRQALNMVQSRAVTMLDAFRKVRRFDFAGAARVLAKATPVSKRPGFVPTSKGWYPKGVSTLKTAGNNWLEYHFGWEPLVKDVYASMEILHNPVNKFASIHGKAKTTAFTDSGWQNAGSVSVKTTYQWTCTHKQGAFVSAVQAPPLHTLEQLGLLNPAVLAWEVVPFSFVVDWFVNVGDVLRSYSDFAGMTLTQPWSITIVRCNHSKGTRLNKGFSPPPNSGSFRSSYANGLYVERERQLTKPVFSVRPLRLPSVSRAATAISLLAQGLKGR